MKKNLFIAGCARSGTSALVQLLTGSSRIVLGMERYGHLVQANNFKLTPEHFTKERFLTLESGDTFYDNVLDFHKFDPNIVDKLDTCEWIGDKRHDLYEVYDQLFGAFPDAKVIFIYRNISEVASSFHGRIQEGKNWPASKNFESAVREWNRSLFLTKEAIKKGYDISVVEYNTLFCSSRDLSPLFNLLDIEVNAEVKERITSIRKRSEVLKQERKQLLSENEMQFIKDNAKTFLIEDLNSYNLFGN